MKQQAAEFPLLDRYEVFLNSTTEKVRYLGILSMAILPFLVCIDVIMRFFGYAVLGSLELQENLLVLNTFSTIALLQIQKSHMGIDLVYERMSEFWQKWSDIVVCTITLIILGVLTYESAYSFLIKMGTFSFELKVPLEWYYWMPPAGLGLAFIVAALQFVKDYARCLAERHYFAVFLGLAFSLLIIYAPFWYRNSDYEVSNLILGSIIFLLMFLLLFIRMPIGWAMCTLGGLGMIAIARSLPAALATVGTTPYTAVAAYNFVALPMFVLMGALILYSGVSQDLFSAANKWMGHMPGGIGMATVAGCTGFAAVCGDSMSTAVTMGSVALPEMNRLKYDTRLSTGALAAGGTLGILIPPSSGFIIYGIVTEVSIGRLFLAGILPGLLLAALFMAYIYITAVRHPEMAPRGQRYPLKERLISTIGIFPMLALFMLVLGGIVGGLFSPTEGGAVGAMGAFLYALARRKVTPANLLSSLNQGGMLAARLMCIMIGVGVLGYFFAATRLPFLLADWIVALPLNRYVVFAIIVVIFIALGCMMNVIPMLMLILPSLFPTVISLGFDPVWFGVVSVMVMEMGQITPPVGVVVFALAGVAKGIPMETIFRGIVPFLAMIIVGVIIITIFPSIATWLPYTLMGVEAI